MEYYAYLKTEGWRCRRALIRERDNEQCLLCLSTVDLHTHHWDYQRLGNEDPSDLAILCSVCHQRFHEQWASRGSNSTRPKPPPPVATLSPAEPASSRPQPRPPAAPQPRPQPQPAITLSRPAPAKALHPPWFQQKRVWAGIAVLLVLVVLGMGGSGNPSQGRPATTVRPTVTHPAARATQPRIFTLPTAVAKPRCDSSYPTLCIPPAPPVIGCAITSARNFPVLPPDPQHLDADRDGIGCEPITP